MDVQPGVNPCDSTKVHRHSFIDFDSWAQLAQLPGAHCGLAAVVPGTWSCAEVRKVWLTSCCSRSARIRQIQNFSRMFQDMCGLKAES